MEDGRPSERFLAFAERFLVGAMVPLAAGLSADFGLVVFEVTRSPGGAAGAGLAALALFAALWFVFPALRRRAAGAPRP